MTVTAEELEELVVRLLEEGVPPSPIARALDLTVALVKRVQTEVHVRQYGTDDMTEYLDQLRWDAIDYARRVIASGSPGQQDRILGFVLGKEIALGARRTPESQREAQTSLLATLEKMRTEEAKEPDRGQSRFVAVVGHDAEPGPVAPPGDAADQDEAGEGPQPQPD